MPLGTKGNLDPRNFLRQVARLGQDRKYHAKTQTEIGVILPSSFGAFGRYVAARVNALTSQTGTTQIEAVGQHTLVV